MYFDPHVKEYCGAKKLLKGFLTRIKGTAKALNADYFHTKEGAPVYFEESDNFHEMRERFKEMHPRFREAIGAQEEQEFYFVIDRAIFSGDLFDYFLDPTCRDHLITWEKHYIPGEWEVFADSEALLSKGGYLLQRPRNNATDLVTYTFDYLEQHWPKRPAFRRLLVKAVSPDQRTIEVAILCTDEVKTVKRTESRLDRVGRDNYEYLNLHEKTLMDTIRILGRNFFYTALKPYKELYNNYRDDHEMFRNLTRCTGVTWHTGE